MKVFGYEAFVHIDKELRTKLEAKPKKCVFIEYGVGEFRYRLWDYESNKTHRSRDDVFYETFMYKDHLWKSKKGNANA